MNIYVRSNQITKSESDKVLRRVQLSGTKHSVLLILAYIFKEIEVLNLASTTYILAKNKKIGHVTKLDCVLYEKVPLNQTFARNQGKKVRCSRTELYLNF